MELICISPAELLGVTFALSLVGTAAAYLYYNKPKGCLNPEKFMEFKLEKKTQLSPNTAKFRFALPTPTSVLGLPVGQHIICRGIDSEGLEVIRQYTPITLDSDVGYFELVVKMYPKGRMSHHFREMREGDYLSVLGPKGNFKYKPGQARELGMLAGDSGITPMFQIIRAILENPKDKTNVHLIYAGVTLDDMLLKKELDAFASKFRSRFEVYYVLSQPPVAWNGGTGKTISREVIQSFCQPAQDIQILRCGSAAMAAQLNALGYKSEIRFESMEWSCCDLGHGVVQRILRECMRT
nr:NADH--cytochrome b5 reductase 1-like [Quercus suber]POE65399.1 nadh--cytochrome b5 reductase 1 [Quercus suber]